MPFPIIYFFLCVIFFVGIMMSWKVLINSGKYFSGILGLIVSVSLLVLTVTYLVKGFNELKEFKNLNTENIMMMKLETTNLDSELTITLDTAEITSIITSLRDCRTGFPNHPEIEWKITAQIYLPNEHILSIDIYTTTNNGSWAELISRDLMCDQTKEIIEKIYFSHGYILQAGMGI